MKTSERFDVYQLVTDKIITLLESGVVPWRKPWAAADGGAPKNLVSGKEYRGINVWMLHASGYSSPYWVSYKQAQDLGGNVRKGEKSSLAVFWKMLKVTDKDAQPGDNKTKQVPVLRYYHVFNLEQCDGIEYPKPEPQLPFFDPVAEADKLVDGFKNPPSIVHTGGKAFYRRSEDRVTMPEKTSFSGVPEYYSTLFHELIHATGHDSRLKRLQNSVEGFGSTSYAKEELVAEMGAGFLCAISGIENATLENSAAYIANWLGRLKDDRKLVVHAAAQAQKAVDWITGKTFEEKAGEE